ncbi:hypothetical protein [Pseudoroseicyclus tamaricis]|uniref:Uncharacterized protein n=1 Tax=Pseudoroseicyclus tamaricis TaxID=2705421 RepID=A0A6B2JW31_9RHOB|nr:hypothetical protein [Pseudoroseicyclus tamaricis]NDV02320.1 hypothetical protein [Pseudoroseicyclus tamaricis]
MTETPLDHFQLEDTRVTRRYFGKFAGITGHLARVAAQMEAEGRLSRREVQALARYLVGLTLTFKALGLKYRFAGRLPNAGKLTIDRVESGFPVLAELLVLANDAVQAQSHLAQTPTAAALKDEMVRFILAEQEMPTRLQYTLSQRLYYEELAKGDLFLARNDPEAIWLKGEERRTYLIRWAVYDGAVNLPVIYLMEVEDSGRVGLPKDEWRWPEVQAHLMAQAVGGLKLLTIAKGFDADFADLHPKRLRRFHIGPMYSHQFTAQSGPIREVLERAHAPEGEDWALVWTEEELLSERVEVEKAGWFGKVEREVFALDPFAGGGPDSGASRQERAVILPERPYQSLAELNPPGFSGVRKFVVGSGGRVLSYR